MRCGGRKDLPPSTGPRIMSRCFSSHEPRLSAFLPISWAVVWSASSPHVSETLQAPAQTPFSMTMSRVAPEQLPLAVFGATLAGSAELTLFFVAW